MLPTLTSFYPSYNDNLKIKIITILLIISNIYIIGVYIFDLTATTATATTVTNLAFGALHLGLYPIKSPSSSQPIYLIFWNPHRTSALFCETELEADLDVQGAITESRLPGSGAQREKHAIETPCNAREKE